MSRQKKINDLTLAIEKYWEDYWYKAPPKKESIYKMPRMIMLNIQRDILSNQETIEIVEKTKDSEAKQELLKLLREENKRLLKQAENL